MTANEQPEQQAWWIVIEGDGYDYSLVRIAGGNGDAGEWLEVPIDRETIARRLEHLEADNRRLRARAELADRLYAALYDLGYRGYDDGGGFHSTMLEYAALQQPVAGEAE